MCRNILVRSLQYSPSNFRCSDVNAPKSTRVFVSVEPPKICKIIQATMLIIIKVYVVGNFSVKFVEIIATG